MLLFSFQSVHKYFIMEINKFLKFITQTEENAVKLIKISLDENNKS